MLEIGNVIPEFAAQDQNGNIVSSADLIGKKTVVYFYPKANTPGCTAEACSLRDNYERFLALGYNVIGISKDSVKAQKNFSTEINEILAKSKNVISSYKLPVIPKEYYTEASEAGDAIGVMVKELNKKPISIKVLNIRVDTARDLVFKIYNKTNDMIKTASNSERIIIYGNRYRSSYEEIDIALTKAEELFKRGKYKESLDLSIKSLSFIDKNITEKF